MRGVFCSSSVNTSVNLSFMRLMRVSAASRTWFSSFACAMPVSFCCRASTSLGSSSKPSNCLSSVFSVLAAALRAAACRRRHTPGVQLSSNEITGPDTEFANCRCTACTASSIRSPRSASTLSASSLSNSAVAARPSHSVPSNLRSSANARRNAADAEACTQRAASLNGAGRKDAVEVAVPPSVAPAPAPEPAAPATPAVSRSLPVASCRSLRAALSCWLRSADTWSATAGVTTSQSLALSSWSLAVRTFGSKYIASASYPCKQESTSPMRRALKPRTTSPVPERASASKSFHAWSMTNPDS
mmetsp:Transcript_11406/g.31121  ORF Transcript_11406/g.31121 Transcript_11406/m.31121 type:complete len:302 (-) Transcript_11406:926-1831(-)